VFVVGGAVVVVVVGATVVVVVVGATVVVVVVVGGVGLVVVVVVVVVGGVFFPPEPPTFAFVGEKVNSAAAQSCGWAATTTSRPGSALKLQTATGGPVSRHANAGSVVVSRLNVPRYCAVPSAVGETIGDSGTAPPFQTPMVM
jgi:hypothetical protein